MVKVVPGLYEHRNIFFFKCKLCGKKRRSSLKEKNANEGKCAKCRRGETGIDPRQTSLLPPELTKAAEGLLSLTIRGKKYDR